MENNLLNNRKYLKEYRTAGIVIFAMSVAVLLVRIAAYYLSGLFEGINEYVADFALDAIFSVTVQVFILFLMPLFIYKIVLKKNLREVFAFSNFRKTKPVNILLAVGIGMLGIVVTIGISLFWQILLMMTGYMPSSSASVFPLQFNPWIFLGSMFITAVLPGFCEEFTMRGGFLTALRSAFPFVTVIVISALSFGLFHQYILQTLYTACFGALMAFITIRTKSIFPAMVVHFVNNGLSVYLDYAEAYDWAGGGFFESITTAMLNGNLVGVFFVYFLVVAAFVTLIYVLSKLNPSHIQQPIMLDGNPPASAAIRPNFLGGNLDTYTVKKSPPLEFDGRIVPRAVANTDTQSRILFVNNRYYALENNVLYALKPRPLLKPTLSDNVFYIGALVVSILSTIFTMVWGYIM